MSFWDEVKGTFGDVKDGFLDLLSGVKDNYVEITKAVGGTSEGALGSDYSQSTKGVNNTGKPITGTTGNSWFQENWLLILFVLLLIVGMIAAVKWVL